MSPLLDSLLMAAYRRSAMLRQHLSFDRWVEHGGRRFKIPYLLGDWVWYHHEPWLLSLLSRLLPLRSGRFVDVGANRGQTLLKVAAVAPEQGYVGFEPDVFSATLVQRLIDINHLEGFDILPVGLGERSGVGRWFISRYGSTSSTTAAGLRDARYYKGSRTVSIMQGDFALSELGVDAISVLKIDVEGAELEALRGLEDTLATYRPWLIFEVLPPWGVHRDETRRTGSEQPDILVANQERAAAIAELLRAHGYVSFQLRPGRDMALVEHFDPGEQFQGRDWNFLAVPAADQQAVDTGWLRDAPDR